MRAGAMRRLAAFVAQRKPELLAICEMPSGDALSLATRFDLRWAYRGRLALFWSGAFQAGPIDDARRRFLRVDGDLAGAPCAVVLARFSRDRARRIPDLRFVRTELRSAPQRVLLFAVEHDERIGFRDLGFANLAAERTGVERIYVRGFEDQDVQAAIATV